MCHVHGMTSLNLPVITLLNTHTHYSVTTCLPRHCYLHTYSPSTVITGNTANFYNQTFCLNKRAVFFFYKIIFFLVRTSQMPPQNKKPTNITIHVGTSKLLKPKYIKRITPPYLHRVFYLDLLAKKHNQSINCAIFIYVRVITTNKLCCYFKRAFNTILHL